MKKLFHTTLWLVPFLPAFAFAQNLSKTRTLIASSIDIVNILVYIFSVVALLVFFWGIIKYIGSSGDAGKAQEGKSIMIYGVIALFVMFSVWGIIRFIRYDLGVSNDAAIPAPQIIP